MQKIFTLLVVLALSAGMSFGQGKDNLYKLYKAKQFKALNDHNSNNKHSLYLFYKAVYASVCNQPDLSNDYLDEFMSMLKEPPALVSFEYWTVRNDNYVKLFDYPNAQVTLEKLLKDFKHKYEKNEYRDEQYTVKIWKSLAKEKGQTISRKGKVLLPMKRDIAGLININVSANNIDSSFVLDTGAGISSITESFAEKMGLRIMPDTGIKVAGFSNIYNPVRIGIAEELKIGDITVHNAPFLVFRDDAFTFAGGAYKINGIIGFPIAKDMGTITITPDHLEIDEVPAEDSAREKTLFIELLRPVLFLKYKGKTLPFNFDTGAGASQFSRLFYDEYGKDLKKTGKFETSGDASAGGVRMHQSLIVNNVRFYMGDHEINFPKIDIDTENYHVSGKELYGNLGQDLLKQYNRVTISFKGNYLKLE
jgi:hypothetical protein